MATMKQVIGLANADLDCRIESGPIPEPRDDQVLIKVMVSGSNPKDWKMAAMGAAYEGPDDGSNLARAKKGMNHGDDIAGIVERVGKDVLAFEKGDRVAAFHEMVKPGGSFAEYAVAPEHTTFHIPPSTSFEEAATIPLAALTAAVALFHHLRLPMPWAPAVEPTPLLIYGASTSVGSYAVKLARQSNIHPIIAVAGKGGTFVETIIDRSKGDAVFDYRKGDDHVTEEIRAHLKAGSYGQIRHGIDPGIGESSKKILTQIVAPDGAINLVIPSQWDTGSAVSTSTLVGSVHDDDGDLPDTRDLGLVTSRWITRALQQGKFSGHPFEIRPGGLQAVEQALRDLRDGKNSASKYVFRIADTPGL